MIKDKQFKEFVLLHEIGVVLAEYELAEAKFIKPTKDNQMYIDPKTGKNWRAADRLRRLAAIVKQQARLGVNPERIWVSFSDVPRLGYRIQFKQNKSTPVGVFGYPATYVLKNQGEVETFGDRAYMLVLRLKGMHGEVGVKPTEYKWNDDKQDYEDIQGEKIRPGVESLIAALDARYNKDEEDDNDLIQHLNTITHDQLTKNQQEILSTSKAEHGSPEYQAQYEIGKLVAEMLSQARDYVRSTLRGSSSYNLTPDYPKNIPKVDLDGTVDPRPFLKNKLQEAKKSIDDLVHKYEFYSKVSRFYEPSFEEITFNSNNEVVLHVNARFMQQRVEEYGGKEEFEQQTGVKPEQLELSPLQFFKVYYGSTGVPSAFTSVVEPYLMVKKLVEKGGSFPPDFQAILDEWKKRMHESFEKYLANYEAPDENEDDELLRSLPQYPKLKAIVDQYGLSLSRAIPVALGSTVKIRSGQQLIYRITQALAMEAQEKLGRKHYHALWNKFLRMMDWESAMDTKHSSGIHASEPTQGVFLDLRQVQLIAILESGSHLDIKDPTGRPPDHSWDSGAGKHDPMQVTMSKQRFGPFGYQRTQLADMGGLERTTYVLGKRLADLRYNLDNTVFDGYTSDASTKALTQAIKLASSGMQLAKFQADRQQRLGITQPSAADKSLTRNLGQLERFVQDAMARIHELQPINQQQLMQLQSILNGESTPFVRYGPKASQKFVAPATQM